MTSIKEKLFVLGYVRENTIENASLRKIQRRFVFNTGMSFGPATAEFDELHLTDSMAP